VGLPENDGVFSVTLVLKSCYQLANAGSRLLKKAFATNVADI